MYTGSTPVESIPAESTPEVQIDIQTSGYNDTNPLKYHQSYISNYYFDID